MSFFLQYNHKMAFIANSCYSHVLLTLVSSMQSLLYRICVHLIIRFDCSFLESEQLWTRKTAEFYLILYLILLFLPFKNVKLVYQKLRKKTLPSPYCEFIIKTHKVLLQGYKNTLPINSMTQESVTFDLVLY